MALKKKASKHKAAEEEAGAVGLSFLFSDTAAPSPAEPSKKRRVAKSPKPKAKARIKRPMKWSMKSRQRPVYGGVAEQIAPYSPKEGKRHYMQLKFSIAEDLHPEIYDFLWKYLPRTLLELGIRQVSLEIERLEPLNSIYTNLDNDRRGIRKIFEKFCRIHGLEKAPALTLTSEMTSVKAKIRTVELEKVLKDYDLLFDLFFTDLLVRTPEVIVDMMNGFENSVLLVSKDKKFLEQIGRLIKAKCSAGLVLEWVEAQGED